jgi:hypothetical protein
MKYVLVKVAMFVEGSHHQQGYVLITEMETMWILKEFKI